MTVGLDVQDAFYLQKIVDGVVLGASPRQLDFFPVDNQPHLLNVERRLGVIVCLIQRAFSFMKEFLQSKLKYSASKTVLVQIYSQSNTTKAKI